jgi:cellulose synthase/poly-beta-1,6-N-acetylglucosamine synthase-like glycosyltransferase
VARDGHSRLDVPWYRDVARLAQATAERGGELTAEQLEECRAYVWHLEGCAGPDKVLPPTYELLVREIFGRLFQDEVPAAPAPAAGPSGEQRVAVVIACKNGASTIGRTVGCMVGQADVFVVSDGSTDGTVETARRAGAWVLDLPESGGKPAALRAANAAFALAQTYAYIAVLDDDTVVGPDYVAQLVSRMDADARIAVTSGRIESEWTHTHRWNPLIAMRAFMYWSYQTTMKRGQNALRSVNVICGANSIFRADVFALLTGQDAPYAVDDMFWMAEIARRKIGRVEYVHDARSWTMDPHRFRDWYRQTVRWSWGQFQSIRGHRLGVPLRRDETRRLGVRFSWFDTAYLMVLLDWVGYALEPVLLVAAALFLHGWIDPMWFAVFYLGSNAAWMAAAAIAMRRPRLLALAPALLALDLVYRATMVHAAYKAIRQPRVETCRWESPERFDLGQQH